MFHQSSTRPRRPPTRRRYTAAFLASLAIAGLGAAVNVARANPGDSPGTIRTVAGTTVNFSQGGFSGDGGPATQAQLNEPRAFAVGWSGEVYIADSLNERIRRIDTSGNISTFAGSPTLDANGNPIKCAVPAGPDCYGGDGGPATQAKFNEPDGVALDSHGNLYISDSLNARIRKVDTSGTITTFAGTGDRRDLAGDGGQASAAGINDPKQMMIRDDILYFCDTGNNKIRTIDLQSNVIKTVAGNTQSRHFGGDGGLATRANLNSPKGVWVQPDGTMYISDTDNNLVRKVTADGKISTIAGDVSAANAAAGNTAGADPIPSDSGGDGGPAANAHLNGPRGIIVDPAGNIYVAETLGARIRRIDPSGIITTIAGDGTVNGPGAIAGDPGPSPALQAEFNWPHDLLFDPSHNLWIADSKDNRVRVIVNPSNAPQTAPGAPTIRTATRGNGSAIITWAQPTDNGGVTVTRYTVTSSGAQTATVDGNTVSATVTGLTNGTAYTFTVDATNSIGTSPESAPSNSVTPATVPGPPTMGTATRGNGSASVTWAAPADTGSATVTGYTVTSSRGQTATVNGNTLSATMTGLTNGSAYAFTVHATNDLGSSPESATSGSVTPATVPGAPTMGAVTRGNGSATVTWSAPADNGGLNITSYTVTSSGGQTATVDGTALSATVTGLSNKTAYAFTVHATNSVGNGVESAAAMTSHWETVAPMLTARGGLAAVWGHDGRLYALGGFGEPSSTYLSSVEAYTPATNGWTAVASMSTPRYSGAATVGLDGRIYALGGSNAAGRLNSVEAYDSKTNTWTPVAPMLTTRGNPAAATGLDGRIYAIGGFDPITGFTASVEAYDPATNTWAAVAPMSTPRYGAAATSGPDGRIYVMGGNDCGYSLYCGLATVEAYTPSRNTWSTVASMAATRSYLGAATGADGRIYAVGGTTATGGTPAGELSSAEAYAPSSNTWVSAPSLPTPTTTLAVAASGHAIYALGGSDGTNTLRRVTALPVGPPGAPTIATATTGNSEATATWSPPASDGGIPITGYTATAAPGGQTVNIDDATFSATFTGLANGTAYTFTVAATNAAGTGSPSAPSLPVTPRTVPAAPTGVSATVGDGQATVSWSAPVNNGGAAIRDYTVTVISWAAPVKTLNVAGTSTTISGLANGTAYTFTVAATNPAGAGPQSVASSSVTPTGPADPVVIPAKARSGYWMVGSDGTVYPFGDAKWLGNAASSSVVNLKPTPSGNGYWIVDDLGRVFALGDALALGNVDRSRLAVGEKVTSLSATRSGTGYWIFTSKGRVLPFGDAPFLGDVSGLTLAGPVLDSIPTPSGLGYYMVASDGGIFAFGDAKFYGSMGGQHLNAPVQSLVPDSDGVGYWLVAADGGIFAFGDAGFHGSMGSAKLNKPITGMVRAGHGYLMVGEDGGIFDFSGTTDRFKGSLGANPPAHPITSVAVLEDH